MITRAIYCAIFYVFLRKLAIKRVPKFDIWFRRVEFVILAQIAALFVIVWIWASGIRWGSVRWAPRFLEHLYGSTLQFRGEIPRRNCILVCNHQSGLDLWPLLAFMPEFGTAVAKDSLRYYLGLPSVVLQQLKLLFINRRQKAQWMKTFDDVRVRLENDAELFSVLIFPEGTRGNGKTLLPFKLGAFHIAVASGIPIVPIVIASHEKYAGKDTFPVSILDPIESVKTEENSGELAKSLSARCRTLMEAEFQRLNAAADLLHC